MNKLFKIGITGPSGAGKGAVSGLFTSAYNIPVLDADVIYHEILESSSDCRHELTDAFGESIQRDGKIDRAALGAEVFSENSNEKIQRLNKITHKYVFNETRARIDELEKRGIRYAIIDAPLLIEAGMHEYCDTVICVLANRKTRVARIMERDGISLDRALMRIKNQKADEFYVKASSFTVENDHSREELAKRVDEIARLLGIEKQ